MIATSIASALERYPERANDALEYFHSRDHYVEKQTWNWLVHPCSQIWTEAIAEQTWLRLEGVGGQSSKKAADGVFAVS